MPAVPSEHEDSPSSRVIVRWALGRSVRYGLWGSEVRIHMHQRHASTIGFMNGPFQTNRSLRNKNASGRKFHLEREWSSSVDFARRGAHFIRGRSIFLSPFFLFLSLSPCLFILFSSMRKPRCPIEGGLQTRLLNFRIEPGDLARLCC